MYQLREHQIKKGIEVANKLEFLKLCYLSGEVRSGKTLTSLYAARLFNAGFVLFITKKKAIPSIQKDYKNFGFNFHLDVINYESLHKLEHYNYDLIIYDEAHSLGAYPKPSKRTKQCKKIFSHIPTILMSGTPSVESYSQFYHQFYVSNYSPFKDFTNFYKWAKAYVNTKQIKLPTHTITNYSDANIEKIDKNINPYLVKMTQADAGIKVVIEEKLLTVPTPLKLVNACNELKENRVLNGKDGYILGDTPTKLRSKIHQLINGHCIIERDDLSTFKKVFSTYKADYIKNKFGGFKLAIMYYYTNELDILKKCLNITDNIEEFNNSNKSIAVQQSSTEGLNLSKADAIIYYNFGFSGKNYLQSRDRLTVKGRAENKVYFLLEDYGYSKQIYNRISKKKDFNTHFFNKWLQDNKPSL